MGGDRTREARHVFVSYVREDTIRVDRLQMVLEAAGVPVWRDTANLWPGDDWRVKIRDAIRSDALVFLACFSKTNATRRGSAQNAELRLAIEEFRQRRPCIPWLILVRFDNCGIPDWDIGSGHTLASIQSADVFEENFAEGAAHLAASLLRLLEPVDDTIRSNVTVSEGTRPGEPRRTGLRHLELNNEFNKVDGGIVGSIVILFALGFVNHWLWLVVPEIGVVLIIRMNVRDRRQ